MRCMSRAFCLFGFFLLTTPPALAADPDFQIHGSNTVGARLAPMLAEGFLGQLTGQAVESSGTGIENEQVLTAGDSQILVAAHGSSTGFQALLDGQAQIWASSRPVRAGEAERAARFADLNTLESEHVIAIDGIAILVHSTNPVTRLTTEQIGQIFSGNIRNWKEINGLDLPINLYARDDRSGTWDTFSSMVLKGDLTLHDSARRYESNDNLSDDVSQDPGGIGFSGLASIRNSKAVAVADGAGPALAPTRLSVASEDYPLARRLFLYTLSDQAGDPTNAFVRFAHSSDGQALVDESGFVSQNPIALDPDYDPATPDTFRRLTSQHQRLSVNFRFAEGHTELDNKARRDLIRVRDYLKTHNMQGEDLMLIGFADRHNDELHAQMISELRALSVATALRRIDVTTRAVTGYGHYMPVGAEGGAVGAYRNGRVEVWVRRP